MNYNNAQLQQLWTNASGGDPTGVAPTMAAIALAESGGNAACVNTDASEGANGSWGLWQINGDAWPQYDHQSLLNAPYNAGAAVNVYAAQGLNAWSTYKSGAYKAFLSGASSGSGSPISQFVAVTQTSLNPLVLLNTWISNSSVNVLYKTFALLSVLVVLGAIAPTQRYAGWATLCILFVLLIQQQPAANSSPSGSTQTV